METGAYNPFSVMEPLNKKRARADYKKRPEDFLVREIMPDGTVLDPDNPPRDYPQKGRHAHYILEKRNWDQFKAIAYIASALGVPASKIGWAGTKDKYAVTVQRISIPLPEGEHPDPGLKDIRLVPLGRGPAIRLGDLWGNRFRIVLWPHGRRERDTLMRACTSLLDRRCLFPNYYGIQRFGEVRPITHIVGREILRGRYENAVRDYVCLVFPGEKEEHKEFREKAREMLETGSVRPGDLDIPEELHYERLMLEHLARNPGDYEGAIRRLPPNLSRMFVHAYQSHLFNKTLSILVREGVVDPRLVVPVVGYKSRPPRDERVRKTLSLVLGEEQVSPRMFRLEGKLSYLSATGSERRAYERARHPGIREERDGSIVLSFDLPRATYATTLLNELLIPGA